jgi:tRNA A37 methylthiotransferase MiaB
LAADGYVRAAGPEDADLVVVNTCAFIEAARQESVDTVLALAEAKADDARLVVTGCMAERYGDELAAALPEADLVAGFGVPVTLGVKGGLGDGGLGAASPAVPSLDLLNLPRPKSPAPWAYVKVAEGCDRVCGFCAIPSFRGKQRSRTEDAILAEVDVLEAQEIVLVAQDLASYGKDQNRAGAIVPLVRAVAQRVPRTRLLYLYPSDLTDGLIDAVGPTSTCRCSTCRSRCCGACGGGATASASCGAWPTSGGDSLMRRSGRTLSSGIRARPRPTTTSCWPSSTPPNSTGAGSSPIRRRRARTRRGSTVRSMLG